MADEITDKVMVAIAATKNIPVEQVSVEKSLVELGLDSLDVLTLLFRLEEAFHISIPDEGVRNVRTVQDIVDGVSKLISSAEPPIGASG